MRYTCSGERGRPVLLLHEMGGSLESWDPVLERLPRDQRIIRCDMRGAGGSEKIRAEVTCDVLADDIVSLLDHLAVTEAVDVAGVAIGGCLGLSLAARFPGRVNRLAAINPPTDAIGRSGEVLRERASTADTLGMRGVVEKALARSYPEHLRTDKDAYEAYVARFVTNDPTSYAYILRALANVNFEGVLEKIVRPTIFISGRDDLVRLAADIAVVARRVEGARFLEIDGGHIPSVQAPVALAAALTEFFEW
jgi:3-oxoadipate enol-lactonase